MRPTRPARALAVAAALAGCSAFEPYPTVPAPAPPADPGTRVAICFNELHTPAAAVRDAAQRECPPNTAAELRETDHYMQVCPVLLPGRATFVCVPRR